MSELPERYVLEEQIAECSRASVWLCRDSSLDRRVVLKRFRSLDNAGAERVAAGYDAIAGVCHPNVCQIYRYGTTARGGMLDDEEALFVVMEFIEGPTLDVHLETHRCSTSEAVRLVLKLASGLSAIHESGWVHGWVCPENIILRRGDPVICDFSAIGKVGEKGDASLLVEQEGMVHYLAPEVASVDCRFDVRMDVYALAVMLYRMLTGTLPFVGDSVNEIMASHLTGLPLGIRHFDPGVNKGIANVCMKGLSRDSTSRYQSMTEFFVALERVSRSAGLSLDMPGNDPADAESDSPIAAPLSVYISAGEFSAAEKAELLSLISELYSTETGDRLVIDNSGIDSCVGVADLDPVPGGSDG